MKKNLTHIFLLLYLTTFSQCFTTASGAYHTISLKPDGLVWGTGVGSWGQLNNGGNNEYSFIQISTTNDWQKAYGGYLNTYLIKNNGTLWACGDNTFGQLGINNTSNAIFSFQQVGTATNWKEIASTYGFTLGLKTNGTLWGCGRNDFAQLGQGSIGPNQLTFIQIGTATDWKTIAVSHANICLAIKNNGTLWGWGQDNALLDSFYWSSPTQLGTDINWDKIVMGDTNHVVALKTNGELYCWGISDYGQTGGNGGYYSFKTQIQGTWVAIGAGFRTSFGIKTDGTLWAWGWNEFGQLGQGTTDTNQHQTPVQVGNANNWVSVNGGDTHTFALRSDGSLWSWGNNDYGQLGNGTTTATYLPENIPVAGCNLANETFESNVKLVVYPNPSTSEVSINYKGIENVDTIEIIDSLGKMVYTTQALSNNSFSTTLNLPNLQSGTYIVVLKNKNNIVVTDKLMVK